MYRQLAQDNTLSFEARGVMLYLLSHSTNWQPRADDIERAGNIGKKQRRKILAELERAGYLTYHRVQANTGLWGWVIAAHEEPVPESERTHELSGNRVGIEPRHED
jgi:hypothetical protein